MTKQILLPSDTLRELRETFKVHAVVLNRALKFERNSKRDKMLRAAALQRGGLVFTNESTSQVFANFGERVELELCRPNIARVIIDGKTVATFSEITPSNWSNVLSSLQQIYYQLNA